MQIRAVKWLTKSVKKNLGLYLFASSYAAYFGYFRNQWMFVDEKNEKSDQVRRKTQI